MVAANALVIQRIGATASIRVSDNIEAATIKAIFHNTPQAKRATVAPPSVPTTKNPTVMIAYLLNSAVSSKRLTNSPNLSSTVTVLSVSKWVDSSVFMAFAFS